MTDTVAPTTLSGTALSGTAATGSLAGLAVRALGMPDLDELVGEGLTLVCASLGAEQVALVEASSWRVRARCCAERLSPREAGELLAGSEVVAEVLATGRPGFDPALRRPVAGSNDPVAAALLVPVAAPARDGSRADGVDCLLSVFLGQAREFAPAEIEFASTVGTLLAGAIDRDRTEEALRWRSRLDQLLTEVSTSFIHLRDNDLEAGLRDGLALVGRFLAAERAQVFLAEDGDPAGTGPSFGSAAPPDPGWEDGRLPVARWEAETDLATTGGDAATKLWLGMHANGALVGRILFELHRDLRSGPGEIAHALRPLGDMFAQVVTQHLMAAELAASELRYRSLVSEVRDVIVRVDGAGQISFVNQAWSELTGLSVEETLQRNAFDSIHPDDRLIAAEHIASVTRGEDNAARNVRFVAKDGSFRWMEVRGRALFDDEGNFAGLSGVLHDVTDNTLAQDKIQEALLEARRAQGEAERSSRAKSEFLSRMSHELRTPLNAILGFTQLLEYSGLRGEDADNLRLISQAGRHLLALINDALDVSAMETGRLVLSKEPVRVADLWQECLDLALASAADLGVRIEPLAETDGEIEVLADRMRLKQVLVNLLTNAVKYNRSGGTVAVRCRPLTADEAPEVADGTAWSRLCVTDTGIGVAGDHLDDVFVPFNRLGAEYTEVEGTGVGLALAKTFVEAMGGRIGLHSTEGVGSTFYVDLPTG